MLMHPTKLVLNHQLFKPLSALESGWGEVIEFTFKKQFSRLFFLTYSYIRILTYRFTEPSKLVYRTLKTTS